MDAESGRLDTLCFLDQNDSLDRFLSPDTNSTISGFDCLRLF